ncbi:MAG: carbohydrate kinase, partial [Bacteroidaceae bacterium]|nr:carbohydrate kinase [Bacteroidaceae bacterium]
TGILNAWMRRTIAPEGASYAEMNRLAESVPAGSEGVCVIPFGNGAERVLENRETGCSVVGLNFNRHSRAHLLRAAQEGIVFAFCYGMGIMREMGMKIERIHAGRANMFLNRVFRETLAATSGATIELLDTDGAVGAAKGAGLGCGLYADTHEAFSSLRRLETVEPDAQLLQPCFDAYERWKCELERITGKA